MTRLIEDCHCRKRRRLHPILKVDGQASQERKRVTFVDPRDARPPIRSRQLEPTSVSERWVSREAILDSVRSHPMAIKAQASDPNFNMFCEFLAAAYMFSVVDGDASPPGQQLSSPMSCYLLGMSDYRYRGLETFCLSSVATDRLQRRRRHIATVLKAQDTLPEGMTAVDRAELIRHLSERLSASSRTFALAMGSADAVAATLEQASLLTEQPKFVALPCAQNSPKSFSTCLTPPRLGSANGKRPRMPCRVIPPMA